MTDNPFQLSPQLLRQAEQAQSACGEIFSQIEQNAEYNQMKVQQAFYDHKVSEAHFAPTTGYGYGDLGRDATDAVFAQIVGAEDALVRHNFVSGTHALTVALFGILRPSDLLLAVTGSPYDTLEEVIGIRGEGNGSLKDFGVRYEAVALLPNGTPDHDAIRMRAKDAKVCYIQRSRGYALRPSLCIAEIARLCKEIKAANPKAIIMVDNCYGEFAERQEPTQVGADLIIGSLIKNAGGGIAKTGGYIAGKAELVKLCAYRLTSVGTGKEVGCTLGQTRDILMGLFFAPTVVESALKTAVFAAKLFEDMGYEVYPRCEEPRTDIIQAVTLGTPERLIAFCGGIQKGSPIDSFATPEPWDMPGYEDPVIMAAGAFTMGASIELSADAPMREPYAVWMQGGLTYYSAKLGILLAADAVNKLNRKN